jgi:hypothetical protein
MTRLDKDRMTIERIKQDKKQLEDSITKLLNDFEKLYGENSIGPIQIGRWNGSNGSNGKISTVHIGVNIFL